MNDDTSMNSPDLDPLHELASAHLDGATSFDERAAVHASPELTAIVASFSALRAELADLPPVFASVRATGIAAALAVFDELHSDRPVTELAAAASVVQLASRRRWPAFVMSAAAGLALFGVAGVAVFSGGSDDESNARVADKERAMSATAEASADSMTATEMGPASTIGNILASGDVAIVIESPEQLLQLSLSGDVTYDSNAGGSDSTAAAAETTAPTTGNTDLAPQGSPEATRRALTCLSDNQVFLADILYMDELAIAARDTVTGVTVAITDDCRVLVAVGP